MVWGIGINEKDRGTRPQNLGWGTPIQCFPELCKNMLYHSTTNSVLGEASNSNSSAAGLVVSLAMSGISPDLSPPSWPPPNVCVLWPHFSEHRFTPLAGAEAGIWRRCMVVQRTYLVDRAVLFKNTCSVQQGKRIVRLCVHPCLYAKFSRRFIRETQTGR